jgi:cell division protein FtsL
MTYVLYALVIVAIVINAYAWRQVSFEVSELQKHINKQHTKISRITFIQQLHGRRLVELGDTKAP